MRVPRRLPPLWQWRLPGWEARRVRVWGIALLAALLAGYLTAYLIVFPVPILRGHQVVPRVLGLSLQEASAEVRKVGLQVLDGGAGPHPTAPQGTVVWQDPPPGTSAPAGMRVTLVVSSGPPKIPVPDVAGLDGELAQRLVAVARRRTGDASPGTVVAQRPAAGTLAAPGTVVDIVVARSPQ